MAARKRRGRGIDARRSDGRWVSDRLPLCFVCWLALDGAMADGVVGEGGDGDWVDRDGDWVVGEGGDGDGVVGEGGDGGWWLASAENRTEEVRGFLIWEWRMGR
ncbi:unnamed protein product [Linum trigynum]|uniref:Uncharacterized protein n=1 Tax=Linum trigynum TaxID=586398 RepID=A0AAV2CWA1_9ROSI